MDVTSVSDFASRFAPVIAAHRTGAFLAGDMLAALTLHVAGPLSIAWAPFDYVPVTARLVVVGITPGRQQAENALSAFRDALAAGATPEEASRRAKFTGAFSGPMRDNLIAMLDHVGAQRALGVASCATLFDPNRNLLHLTSALRHPVFVAGENYNGAPDMLRTSVLRTMVETHLVAEARALPTALWLPLGSKPSAALRHLVSLGVLDADRVLGGLPHPSGANGERIAYFLGRKLRAALSPKTLPEPLDRACDALRARLSQLVAA